MNNLLSGKKKCLKCQNCACPWRSAQWRTKREWEPKGERHRAMWSWLIVSLCMRRRPWASEVTGTTSCNHHVLKHDSEVHPDIGKHRRALCQRANLLLFLQNSVRSLWLRSHKILSLYIWFITCRTKVKKAYKILCKYYKVHEFLVEVQCLTLSSPESFSSS